MRNALLMHKSPKVILLGSNNSHYETDFGVSSAEGAGNTKISFLKARRWRAFKKLILIMRIVASK